VPSRRSLRRLLDVTLANEPVGKLRVPLHVVHVANQLQLPRIDQPSDAGESELILDISVNDLTRNYRVIWSKRE
jgi:hypothetical protein